MLKKLWNNELVTARTLSAAFAMAGFFQISVAFSFYKIGESLQYPSDGRTLFFMGTEAALQFLACAATAVFPKSISALSKKVLIWILLIIPFAVIPILLFVAGISALLLKDADFSKCTLGQCGGKAFVAYLCLTYSNFFIFVAALPTVFLNFAVGLGEQFLRTSKAFLQVAATVCAVAAIVSVGVPAACANISPWTIFISAPAFFIIFATAFGACEIYRKKRMNKVSENNSAKKR